MAFGSKSGDNYGAGKNLSFSYTIEDKDGDTSTATASLKVKNPNLPEAPSAPDERVNESQLAIGNHLGGGSITDSHTFTLPGGFTVNAGDLGAHILPNGTLTISQVGSTVTYSYTLTSPVNDGTPNVSDGQNTANNANSFTVHLDGPFGQSLTVPVNIDIKDDIPLAHAIETSISASASVNTNLQLVLDVSGSMGNNAGGLTFVSKLLAAKEAIYELLDSHQNAGSVMVQLITFSTGAATQFSTWVSAETLKTTLFTLSAGGSTNYDAPLDQAVNHAWVGDHSANQFNSGNFQNVSYFLSDGEPNVNGGVAGTAGITGIEITNWTTFLNAHNIDSFAFGMGTGATQSTLDPIAYNGAAHTEANATIVSNFNNLPTELTNTVSGS